MGAPVGCDALHSLSFVRNVPFRIIVPSLSSLSFSFHHQHIRYLFGWEWNIEDAEKGLKKTIQWRSTYKPKQLHLKEAQSIAQSGWMFHYGKDKIGHPIIWIVVRNEKSKKNEETKEQMFRYLVWIMENCLEEMKESDAHRITWIVELKGASLSLSTAKSLKDMFYSLGEYYPERLARCVVLNASWLLNAIWVFAQQFMTKSTIAKYVFIKGSEDKVRKELTNLIDPDQLPKDFYGTADWTFDVDEEVRVDEEKRANQ
eukprot:CAMPEP_0117447914 /NCGR_PEP_ID=MMETSP0759-20121206/7122_1 /TAXON_ID=63605 /ORGANISM="Percolomonas cosmopolitus, Strain WS" /LENGTH=257 /DNA_ID=CAMNT_0005240267 /DNA_START=354 /DNA_END=1127 /DNA_ORIENTATION=+